MHLRNTRSGYGLVAILFHWTMALLIIGLFLFGKYMSDLDPMAPDTFALYQLHKSLGFVVLTLMVARLAWRFRQPLARLARNDAEDRASRRPSRPCRPLCVDAGDPAVRLADGVRLALGNPDRGIRHPACPAPARAVGAGHEGRGRKRIEGSPRVAGQRIASSGAAACSRCAQASFSTRTTCCGAWSGPGLPVVRTEDRRSAAP